MSRKSEKTGETVPQETPQPTASPSATAEKRVLLPTPAALARAKKPKFDYPATSVGKTAHFQVYYATSLRQPGHDIASVVLQHIENDYKQLAAFFAYTHAVQFNVIVGPLSSGHDGTGGAYHYSCSGTDLYADAAINPAEAPEVTQALVVAEAVEVFEALQGGGWDCGGSNGEGLSRVLAEALYPGILNDYETASTWLDSSRPDWVTKNNNTDQDASSNGCSVLFLNWLHFQLKYGWDKICQAAAPTLEGTYQKLTGKTDGLQAFMAQINKAFPPGQPSNVTTDNPFPV